MTLGPLLLSWRNAKYFVWDQHKCLDLTITLNRVTVDTMMNRIREETLKDPVLAVLHQVVLRGWPSEYWISVYGKSFISLIKWYYLSLCDPKCYKRYTDTPRRRQQRTRSTWNIKLARNASSNLGDLIIMRRVCPVSERATTWTHEVTFLNMINSESRSVSTEWQ